MERLEKLINILKLTPHRQPELVKEACHRIISRSIRSEPQTSLFLRPLIEILIQYCDNDDGAQRSLFNDHLNSIILTFQHQHYQSILQVLVDELTNNGSARTVTAALHRIPHIIRNVKPIELGCEPQRLLKALIEIARRTDHETVLIAFNSALTSVMPFLDFPVRKNKDMQLLSNSLVEILLRNLQSESSQTKRLAASSLAIICSNSDLLLKVILVKLEQQLNLLLDNVDDSANKLIGFCLCVKEIPDLSKQHHETIIHALNKQIEISQSDIPLTTAALETLRELFKFRTKTEILDQSAKLVAEKYLFDKFNGRRVIKEDAKIVLQVNALACISSIIQQRPTLLDEYKEIFLFKNHNDVSIRNQIIRMIGHYIEAVWRFPISVEQTVDCERVRKLWIELRSVLNDDRAHPDTLKSCALAIKSCVNTLLESDHCLHIVEYHDFDLLIRLYLSSNFKPFKIEVLGLFASLNYRTLHYLESSHWSKLRAHTAGSYLEQNCLQNRILNCIVIASLVDEHQRVRAAATSAMIAMIPNLYVTSINLGQRNILFRGNDPIVSLAQDLAGEHLVVLKQADEHINHFGSGEEPVRQSELHEKLCIRNDHKFLSSSIIQLNDNPYNEQAQSQLDIAKSQHRVNIAINLMHIVELLKSSIDNSLIRGKNAIASIVSALHELSLNYPVYQYSTSWDCRPSEYCECFTLLNFLLTYLENLIEPDVVVEDLEAYKNFLALSHHLLYGLCHECVISEYEHQKMKPFHKRQADMRDGNWSELTIKHTPIADTLDICFTHLTKLLWLLSYIIEEKNNPFSMTLKDSNPQLTKGYPLESTHGNLTSNKLLFGRMHKKLESSFKSSKKNLNQPEEKFYQILETCLTSMSALLEFLGMSKSIEHVKDILSYLKVTSLSCSSTSLVCARQLLKSVFGINILALYQVDPNDWFEEESWSSSPSTLMMPQDSSTILFQGVYHHLVANPYKIFSNYYSTNCSQITPTSDKALAILNFESRRALKVRRRIEDRVKSLFEHNAHQLVSPKIRQIGEILRNTITEFTPVVRECMVQFSNKGFSRYQSETLHFMSYLILLRVNYQKLDLAKEFVASINKLLDQCSEKMFLFRETGMEIFLRISFTFLTLLSYERGPSKPMFPVATVIEKLDDMRAKLSMVGATERDIAVYVVPLLRCLVEDLFLYRTVSFHQHNFLKTDGDQSIDCQPEHSKKEAFESLEAERETVAQKLIDVIDNPKVYDLLSILILESRQNSSEIKYKKLSQHLLSIIPTMLSKRSVNLADYRCIELTRRIIENISPEVFQPVNFIFETLLEAQKPESGGDPESQNEFRRWMSLVIISIHILNTQVKEEVFLSRLRETMSDEVFVDYLLHIAQLCLSEVLLQLYSPKSSPKESNIVFLTQQLASYILYLTHMFQSGLFFQLSRRAADLIRREVREGAKGPRALSELCSWARSPSNGFCLNVCERMFHHIKFIYPDLTIFWCNIMMLLNNVDCNREYWRNLLVYDCHHCQESEDLSKSVETLLLSSSPEDSSVGVTSLQTKDESKFRRVVHINRPSSLNLSDISFNDQLRRSFIKKIAVAETRDRAFNRNIIETSDEDGRLYEREVNLGNTEQCLSPNIELTRRGALCLVLDFVTISMNDVEHITWLIIHHINDIVRWSHEMPIMEFINAVHGNSASSGIFIQAINSGFNDLTSISLVARLLCTLEQVHYTQYGSLVVLLIEKLLSSDQLLPYRSITTKIEDFACSTVQKLLNETNKSLVTTNDEVVNQLTADDLDRIYSMLDVDLYPKLSEMLVELRETIKGKSEIPAIKFQEIDQDSDQDSEVDEISVLDANANLVYWLAEQNCTAHISSLLPALNIIRGYLSNPVIVERINQDETLVCFLVSAIYSLSLNIIPPPTRLSRPRFWMDGTDGSSNQTPTLVRPNLGTPIMVIGSKRSLIKATHDQKTFITKRKEERSQEEIVEAVRMACLKGLFLVENLEHLQSTHFEHLEEIIIRLARLPLINSFILTPPSLWRQNALTFKFSDEDQARIRLPMATHDVLLRDPGLLDNFCNRLLKLGWICRRQFEEAWMTLLGVLSGSLSQTAKALGASGQDSEKSINLSTSCKVVSAITKLLLLTQRQVVGDPLSCVACSKQTFDERVLELTKAIGTNLSSLKKRTQNLVDLLDSEIQSESKSLKEGSHMKTTAHNDSKQNSGFSQYLGESAQKLRMNAILNVEAEMQDTVVIESELDPARGDDVDVESCIRLLISIYKQEFKNDNQFNATSSSPIRERQNVKQNYKNQSHPLAPPLSTAICHSIIALSDIFTDYEEFHWLFETFVQMLKVAERNEDEIQMQYLIIGLCKSAAVCCYEMPNELATTVALTHKDVMFEKCRQSIVKCVKSEFIPLKMNALFGVYYMLEDSINIVASGAWELDHFKQLRQKRLNWILKLMPVILDIENSSLLTKRPQIIKLLALLCETVAESEVKVMKV